MGNLSLYLDVKGTQMYMHFKCTQGNRLSPTLLTGNVKNSWGMKVSNSHK